MNIIHQPNFKITTFDDNLVRYRLVKKNQVTANTYNWLFLPGGPGADSSYYLSLIENIDVMGNFWLIDFPANGDNIQQDSDTDYNFDLWEKYLIPAIGRFERPILIGHSFGGMFPLLFPILEKILKGFIILNSASKLWLAEVESYAKENNVSTISESGMQFIKYPSQQTFKAALLANAHRHFSANSLKTGKILFERLPFNYKAMIWWGKKVKDINFDAKWIPQTIPTLIMGGTHDYVIPCHIFETDERFHRNNIEMRTIQNAGHFIWLDQMMKEGKIRHLGLSEVTIAQIKEAQAIVPIVSVQNKYSLFERKYEPEVDFCEENSIVFIPWCPLAGGKLALNNPVFTELTSKYQVTAHQLALAWLLKRSPIILPIPGTLQITHLEENVAATRINMLEEHFVMLSHSISNRDK